MEVSGSWTVTGYHDDVIRFDIAPAFSMRADVDVRSVIVNFRADASLTASGCRCQLFIMSGRQAFRMTLDLDLLIRQAIGGDREAITLLIDQSSTSSSTLVVVIGAVLAENAELLALALRSADKRRDRQLIEIARAHLALDVELVDALARDHLVDFPDSLVVAWIAAGATRRDERITHT
jgi:hypothetical protein